MNANTSSLLTVFGGYTGVNRIYEGAYATGILKLILFLSFLLILPTSIELHHFKNILGILVLVWYLYDIFRLPMTIDLVNILGLWVAINIYLFNYQYNTV